jgi:hypothetical protein
MNELGGKKETKKVLGVKRALEISVCREMERERDKYMLLHDKVQLQLHVRDPLLTYIFKDVVRLHEL